MTPAKNLTLRRNIYVTGKRTFGELFVEGSDTPIAVTLEPEYNPAKATVSKSDTAIKAGRYKWIAQNSPKHGLSLRLYDVPGRFDVLVHTGNYDDDTLGCIIPGTKIVYGIKREPIAVHESRKALRRIFEAIVEAPAILAKKVLGQTGWITIVDDAPK